MSNPAQKVVYADFLPDSATVLYTFAGSKFGYANIAFASFCNTGAGTPTITLRLVTTAGTITDLEWSLINDLAMLANESIWYYEDAGPYGSIALRDGDRIVAFSDTADVVAARIVVTEHNSA